MISSWYWYSDLSVIYPWNFCKIIQVTGSENELWWLWRWWWCFESWMMNDEWWMMVLHFKVFQHGSAVSSGFLHVISWDWWDSSFTFDWLSSLRSFALPNWDQGNIRQRSVCWFDMTWHDCWVLLAANKKDWGDQRCQKESATRMHEFLEMSTVVHHWLAQFTHVKVPS